MENNQPSNQDSAHEPEDNLLPEYDFSKGVRGKHYQAYRAAINGLPKQINAQSPTKPEEKSPDGI